MKVRKKERIKAAQCIPFIRSPLLLYNLAEKESVRSLNYATSVDLEKSRIVLIFTSLIEPYMNIERWRSSPAQDFLSFLLVPMLVPMT
jgi:hypothetical protein